MLCFRRWRCFLLDDFNFDHFTEIVPFLGLGFSDRQILLFLLKNSVQVHLNKVEVTHNPSESIDDNETWYTAQPIKVRYVLRRPNLVPFKQVVKEICTSHEFQHFTTASLNLLNSHRGYFQVY
jgi:hypothetical protein